MLGKSSDLLTIILHLIREQDILLTGSFLETYFGILRLSSRTYFGFSCDTRVFGVSMELTVFAYLCELSTESSNLSIALMI